MSTSRLSPAKRKLRDCLAKLVRQKDINMISICELCRMSGVNRTTFYKYYSKIQDIYDEILESEHEYDHPEVVDDHSQNIQNLISILEYMRANVEVSRIINRRYLDMAIEGKILTQGPPTFMGDYFQLNSHEELKKYMYFMQVICISYWLNKEQPESFEWFAQLLVGINKLAKNMTDLPEK